MNNVAFQYNDEPYLINFNKINRKFDSFKNEAINTARYIRSQTTRPIFVAMSGGIDGEFIARIFLEAGVDFTAFSVRYENKENEHDLIYCTNFTKKYNIKHIIVEVESKYLFQDKVFEYLEQGYSANNIFRYLQLFLLENIEKMKGCAVLGSGNLMFQNIKGTTCVRYPKDILVPCKWIENNKTLHFPYFFQTNPELIASYLENELIKLLTSNTSYFTEAHKVKTMFDAYSLEKILLYHSIFPDMEKRRKFNGFKLITLEREIIENFLKQRKMLKIINMPVSTIRQQLNI